MAVRKAIKYSLLSLVWLAAIFVVLSGGNANAPYAIDLLTSLLLTAIALLTELTPLDTYDGALLCPILIVEMSSFSVIRLDISLMLLVFMLNICVIIALKTKKIGSGGIGVLFTVIIGWVSIELYYAAIKFVLPIYYELSRKYSWDFLLKAAFISLVGLIFTTAFIASLKLLSRIFHRWREIFNVVSEKFHDLEVYILLLAAFTLVCFSLLHYFLPHDDNSVIYNHYIAPMKTIFQVMVILVEGIYVCLLLKTVALKEKMKTAEDYSSNLEANLDSLREVRHDVKNLFLTMGSFVERAGDSEMKEFYRENIVPIFKDTLFRSELQNKLKILRDDGLKSFLYFKLSEVSERGIRLSFELSSPMNLRIGAADVVRILGILIDNAAEEAESSRGFVDIRISEDEKMISMRISNSVRDGTRERGIVAGTTDKGIGRGKGLLIAKKIIKKYSNVVLNSYFTDDGFVQNLIIAKN
ncbi:MAG: GHKL domain-containing protein [Eubacteriales bacterium]